MRTLRLAPIALSLIAILAVARSAQAQDEPQPVKQAPAPVRESPPPPPVTMPTAPAPRSEPAPRYEPPPRNDPPRYEPAPRNDAPRYEPAPRSPEPRMIEPLVRAPRMPDPGVAAPATDGPSPVKTRAFPRKAEPAESEHTPVLPPDDGIPVLPTPPVKPPKTPEPQFPPVQPVQTYQYPPRLLPTWWYQYGRSYCYDRYGVSSTYCETPNRSSITYDANDMQCALVRIENMSGELYTLRVALPILGAFNVQTLARELQQRMDERDDFALKTMDGSILNFVGANVRNIRVSSCY